MDTPRSQIVFDLAPVCIFLSRFKELLIDMPVSNASLLSAEDLDPAILGALPVGSEVLSVVPHGKTRWSTGLRVDVEVDGEEKEYFLKIVKRSEWSDMAEAEYESQKALAAIVPDNVVIPMAWGRFERDESKSFFMTCFRDLRDRPPPLPQFLAILKKLHETSISPNGQFGFQVTTYNGPPKMVNDWTSSWEEYFARQFRSDVLFLQNVYGEDAELADLTENFIQKVVARLLRPLQTGGRQIKPSLCHGDLWDGNVQIDVNTKQPIVFDSCAFYGHNEMDLQNMGDPRYIFGMEFIDMYKNEIGASEPQQDFYDRHDMYAIRTDIVVAAICPEWFKLIETSKEKMRNFLARFPNGFGDFKDANL